MSHFNKKKLKTILTFALLLNVSSTWITVNAPISHLIVLFLGASARLINLLANTGKILASLCFCYLDIAQRSSPTARHQAEDKQVSAVDQEQGEVDVYLFSTDVIQT